MLKYRISFDVAILDLFVSSLHIRAVLNGNVPALEVLLEFGCNPMPGSPSKMRKRNRRTSARIETPIEMCERLYNCEEGVGLQIRSLLYTACDLNQGLSHKREKA